MTCIAEHTTTDATDLDYDGPTDHEVLQATIADLLRVPVEEVQPH